MDGEALGEECIPEMTELREESQGENEGCAESYLYRSKRLEGQAREPGAGE